MNMVIIVCPKCGSEKKLSLVDSSYSGPQRCWKCRELFNITIFNNEVRSAEPLSEEEYQRQQGANTASKGAGNIISSPGREEPEIPRLTPERRRDYTRPFSYGGKPAQAEPERPAPGAPPEKPRTFMPFEPAPAGEPEKPEKPQNPPDRFRTFVPLEDAHEEPEKPPATKKPEKPQNPPDRFRTFIPPAT